MCLQNWKFVALPVPEIIARGYPKILSVPGYANTPFSPKVSMGYWAFVRMDTVNGPAKFEVRSFTRS